ncbi:MAG: cell division protein SepF [Blautia sp.]|nr:cell division protein SepF [Lachnospiraceae bacterium]MBP3900072.1 cell division protein SepF [Blautia sp.]
MGVLDKFLDAIKLNDEDDDYLDDDILDDEDDFLDDEEPEEKPRRRFLDKFGSKKKTVKAADDYDDEPDDFEDEYDDDYEDDFDEPEPEPVKRKTAAPRKAAPAKTRPAASTVQPRVTSSVSSSRSTSSYRDDRTVRSSAGSKITPMRQNSSRRSSAAGAPNVEVCVIRPLSMENTREIADSLIEHSTVILNLEGIDVELAQRIIDFTSGACYSLNGTLQKVSSYIFVLGPSNVDITGDLQSILGGSSPSVSAGY